MSSYTEAPQPNFPVSPRCNFTSCHLAQPAAEPGTSSLKSPFSPYYGLGSVSQLGFVLFCFFFQIKCVVLDFSKWCFYDLRVFLLGNGAPSPSQRNLRRSGCSGWGSGTGCDGREARGSPCCAAHRGLSGARAGMPPPWERQCAPTPPRKGREGKVTLSVVYCGKGSNLAPRGSGRATN